MTSSRCSKRLGTSRTRSWKSKKRLASRRGSWLCLLQSIPKSRSTSNRLFLEILHSLAVWVVCRATGPKRRRESTEKPRRKMYRKRLRQTSSTTSWRRFLPPVPSSSALRKATYFQSLVNQSLATNTTFLPSYKPFSISPTTAHLLNCAVIICLRLFSWSNAPRTSRSPSRSNVVLCLSQPRLTLSCLILTRH